MSKLCKQKEHAWEQMQDMPRRYKCTICNVIGKIRCSMKNKGTKVLPIQ